MALSSHRFRRALYVEHVEEAAFLYEQRRQLMGDERTEWAGPGGFEQRFENHLDALCVGGEMAFDICSGYLSEGDPGEVFVALCLACRIRAAGPLSRVLSDSRLEDPRFCAAVVDALSEELPPEWEPACVRALGSESTSVLQVVASVVGARRLRTGGALHLALDRAPVKALPALLKAEGILRESGVDEMLLKLYDHADDLVRGAARLAGIRAHDESAIRRIFESGEASLAPLTFAMAGGRTATRRILLERESWVNPVQAIRALGILGNLAAVRPLVDMLAESGLEQAAAEALYVITGAPLVEAAHMDEVVREDELFARELETYRASGSVPRRVDGSTYGEEVRRFSWDKGHWNAWLDANAQRFDREKRYRLGRLCTPALTLQCLGLPSMPKAYRPLFGEELLIRYGIDIQFDADAPVLRQRAALRSAIDTVVAQTSAFEPGHWYVAKRRV